VGEVFGTLGIAIDHRDLGGPLVLQIAQRLLGHLAGADHQRALVVEAFEYLLGEVGHGHAGDAHPTLVDRRLRGHAPGGLQRALERGMGKRAGALLLGG
jgi:hypothetical protein